ncbi:hypothetical protein [Kutzneria buriramensis]|uniref:hypothetical protein n=1 Tax=Kutzneria buriramensis TaxID=1045776 RepID=UPI000E22B1C2|nr:hypothetical protein [Kutzneria buriramensis]
MTTFAGIVLGAPLGGTLIDQLGAHVALWAATAAGVVFLLAAVIGHRRLHTTLTSSNSAESTP